MSVLAAHEGTTGCLAPVSLPIVQPGMRAAGASWQFARTLCVVATGQPRHGGHANPSLGFGWRDGRQLADDSWPERISRAWCLRPSCV
jgi:hypothetical protein